MHYIVRIGYPDLILITSDTSDTIQACMQKIREISLKTESEGPPPPFVWKCGHPPFMLTILRHGIRNRTAISKYFF